MHVLQEVSQLSNDIVCIIWGCPEPTYFPRFPIAYIAIIVSVTTFEINTNMDCSFCLRKKWCIELKFIKTYSYKLTALVNFFMCGLSCFLRFVGPPGTWTTIYHWWMSWLFRAHPIRRYTLLSLDAVGRALVLPQLHVPGFANSHEKPYPFWGMDGGRE